MALKAILDSIDGVDEGIKVLYKQGTDGKFVLDMEGLPPGMVEKSRLDEFRNSNTNLLKEKDALAAQIEADKAKLSKLAELEEKQQLIDDKELIEGGRVDELVEQRTARRIANLERDHQGQIAAKDVLIEEHSSKYESINGKYRSLIIEQNVNHAISEVGSVRGGAWLDVMARAKGVFSVKDNGDLVAMEGDQIIYGKTADKPLTVSEWLTGLTESAPHLFEDSVGGGGGGGKDKKPSVGPVKSIDASDMAGFGKKGNLEKIASGEIEVRS